VNNFALKGSLRTHIKQKHENYVKIKRENPHECDVCGQTFDKSSKLKEHVLTHTVVKPYKCHLCDGKFSSIMRDTLARNIGTTHEKMRHKKFQTRHRLTFHIRYVHGKSGDFVWGFCDNRFFRDCDKVLHERMHTGHISALIVEKHFTERELWKDTKIHFIQESNIFVVCARMKQKRKVLSGDTTEILFLRCKMVTLLYLMITMKIDANFVERYSLININDRAQAIQLKCFSPVKYVGTDILQFLV
jgi:hypothetical protein